MDTGERPSANSAETLPSLMKETYMFCRKYVEGKDVLDVGCGNGYVHLLINDMAKKITGVDADRETVDKANKRFSGKNMVYYNMTGEKLDFPSRSFDVVISAQSIEHIEDDKKFLREVDRVLKNSGDIFVCVTPNKLSIIPPGEKMYDAPFYPFHVREYTPQQFYDLLEDHFEVIQKVCFYNPDPELQRKYQKTFRTKMIYRLSRFKIVRWLGRNLPLSFKEIIHFFGSNEFDELKSTTGKDETKVGEYHEVVKITIPEVIGAICKKR